MIPHRDELNSERGTEKRQVERVVELLITDRSEADGAGDPK